MSDDDYTDEDPDQGHLIQLSRDQIRSLETRAKKSDENEARAAAAERELAFAKAGIDLNDKKLEYFRKGYDGDLDVEAIQAAGTEAGFLAPPGGSGDAQELATQQRIANAGSEALTAADPTPLEDRLRAAQTAEEIVAIVAESEELRLSGQQ